MALPKRTQERREIIVKIRRNGNFLYNTNATVNTGQLLVCRKPPQDSQKTSKDFTACPKCKGFFTKSNIRHHYQRRHGKLGFRVLQALGRKIIGRIHPIASDKMRNKIYPRLKEDDVVRSIRYDPLVIAYGNKLCVKHNLPHEHDMIRSKLRVLGRFLMCMQNFDRNITSFSMIYDPKYYNNTIKAVNELAQFDEESETYKIPSVAARLGTMIKVVGMLWIWECIKNHDREKKVMPRITYSSSKRTTERVSIKQLWKQCLRIKDTKK